MEVDQRKEQGSWGLKQ